MTKHVPDYLEGAAAERGSIGEELLVSLIAAIEEQTDVQERIAEALEEIARRLDR